LFSEKTKFNKKTFQGPNNPKWWSKFKMAPKEYIFTENSTETPPIEQILNYFWMFKFFQKNFEANVNKQGIPCTTEARSTFFGCTGSNLRFLDFLLSSYMEYIESIGFTP
jgi:hypothetical protein